VYGHAAHAAHIYLLELLAQSQLAQPLAHLQIAHLARKKKTVQTIR
jgi:hypothetical protein